MAKSPSKPSSDLVRENAALIEEATSLYNQINGVWEKAELKIREIGVLRPFEAYLYTDEDGESTSLAVAKEGGKWRIHLVTVDVRDVEEEYAKRTLITECPVELRVNLVERIPKIFEKLIESNREAVADLRKAAAKSAEVFKQLDLEI